jgi:hypothetical protein
MNLGRALLITVPLLLTAGAGFSESDPRSTLVKPSALKSEGIASLLNRYEPHVSEFNASDVCASGLVAYDKGAAPMLTVVTNSGWDCNDIHILSNDGKTFDFIGWQISRVSDIVVSSNGGAVLAPRQLWHKAIGSACIAVWRTVYGYRGGKFVDVSKENRQAYEADLVEITAAVEANARKMFAEPDAAVRATIRLQGYCNIMARDRILRFLGKDPQAGLALAEQWMRDPNPVVRDNAVEVFANIRSEQAMRDLHTLQHDEDKFVAGAAIVAETSNP